MGALKDHFKEYIRYKGITMRKFHEDCGLSPGYMINIKRHIGKGKAAAIQTKYPDLNLIWLETGFGSMLLGEETPTEQEQDPTVRLAYLEAENKMLKERLNEQKELNSRLLNIIEGSNK